MAIETNEKKSTLRNLQTSLGAFGFSIIIHASVLLLVGSFVVFEGVIPKTPFVAVDGVVTMADAEVLPEPPSETNLDLPDTPAINNELSISNNVPEESGAATSADIIVSTGINTTFTLPPAVGPVTAVPRLGVGAGATGTGSGGSGGAQGQGRGTSAGKVVQTLFGSTSTDKPLLVGRFYDTSRRKNGDPVGAGTMAENAQLATRWVQERGKSSVLREYWESKTLLYATHIIIPGGLTKEAFESFGEKAVTPNPAFMVHYTARIALPQATTFRFNTIGNDVLAVLIDGKPVSITDPSFGDWQSNPTEKRNKVRFGWESTEPLLFPARPSYDRYTYGDWLSWGANEYHKIDILIGDAAVGGSFFIFVEEQGKKYKEQTATKEFNAHAGNRGIPILPIFKVDRVKLPEDILNDYRFKPLGYEERGPTFLVQ
jgi:hypothetical protein